MNVTWFSGKRVARRIGFVSTHGSDGSKEAGPGPAADLSGDGWEFWFQTRLRPNEPTRQGDGVLRLNGASFVRVAWQAGEGRTSCRVERMEGVGPIAHLEFEAPISTAQELASQLTRCMPTIAQLSV